MKTFKEILENSNNPGEKAASELYFIKIDLGKWWRTYKDDPYIKSRRKDLERELNIVLRALDNAIDIAYGVDDEE